MIIFSQYTKNSVHLNKSQDIYVALKKLAIFLFFKFDTKSQIFKVNINML